MRSGSTLMETMLDAHPQVWGLGEDSVFNSRLPAFQTEFVAEVSKGDLAAANDVIARFGSEILNAMKRGLQRDPSVSKEKKRAMRRIVDKMLFNYNNLGMLHMIFPNAPVIHMVRDPMDTLFSCYKHKFDEDGLRWSLDFDLLVDQYVAYLEIMAHFRKVLPGRVYDVRYEELVEDPERVMRGVVKHIGVGWDSSILEFYRSNRSVQTMSSSQVRQKLYISSIGGWTKYADELAPMIKRFRKHLPRLKEQGALPLPKYMNWRMDPKFPYQGRPASAIEVEVSVDGDLKGGLSRKGDANFKRRRKTSARSRQRRKRAKKMDSTKRVNRKRKSRLKSSSDKTPAVLESLKSHCTMNMNMPDQQALTIAKSFDYEVTNVEVAKLVACAYVCRWLMNSDSIIYVVGASSKQNIRSCIKNFEWNSRV